MPVAKPRRFPGGWVPTITAPASTAEVHRIVVIGVVTSLHVGTQQPVWLFEAWQMGQTFEQEPDLGLLCTALHLEAFLADSTVVIDLTGATAIRQNFSFPDGSAGSRRISGGPLLALLKMLYIRVYVTLAASC